MNLSLERGMVVQAVLDGQISADHVTVDELVTAHHLLADASISQSLYENLQRDDVMAFDLPWQYLSPN